MRPEFVALLAWLLFVSFAASIITIYLVYQLCIKNSSEWINKTYRNLTIIITISFTATSIVDAAHVIGVLCGRDFAILRNVADIFYFLGDALFYIMILLRIYVPFELSKCIVYFLSLFIIMFVIAAIFYMIVVNLYYDNDTYWNILDAILMCVDFVLNSTILVIFAKRMRSMISHIDPSTSKEAQNKVYLISNTVIKHCALFGISMIINQGFYTFYLSWRVLKLPVYSNFYGTLSYSIRAFENISNVIILWLMLRINYDKYICLCGCCHRCIGRCCFKNIDTKAISDNPYIKFKEDDPVAIERSMLSRTISIN